MGQYLITYPDIRDADLVFDKEQTKQILAFFYPHKQNSIAAMDVTDDARRLAQTMLIAAVDGSADMSYVEAVFKSFSFAPGRSLQSWVNKLAQGLAKAWFKNATQKDLLRANIYESVRLSIASACVRHFQLILDGIATRVRLPKKVYVCVASNSVGRV